MYDISPKDPRIASISSADVSAFLSKKGWKSSYHPNGKSMIFAGPPDDDGRPIEFFIPRKRDYVDTPLRMAEVINFLAFIENRLPDEIIHSIGAIDRDIIYARVISPQESFFSIPLDKAAELVSGLKSLVLYAACMEENPRPFFPKATNYGKKMVERCHFGHTVQGSFGFTLEMPLKFPIQLTLPGEDGENTPPPPPERRIFERIMRGFRNLYETTVTGDTKFLSDYRIGFNANLSEVILEMSRIAQGYDFEYSVEWSPELKASPDIMECKNIRVPQKSYQYLESLAHQLRRGIESEEKTITGTIVQLKAAPGSLDEYDEEEEPSDSDRTVVILAEEKNTKLRVHVPLEIEEYRKACDAHRDGKRVSVKGRLEKEGKSWTIFSPSGFRQLDE